MRLLDLFSGAGGSAMGYYRAGFDDITGVDINPQTHYPFRFIQADAMTFPLDGYDLVHASPPCQAYSITRSIHKKDGHPMMIEAVREKLLKNGRPFVIENVKGSPLNNYLMLCGSMFKGLKVYRHRLFETYPYIFLPPMCCNHKYRMPASKGQYHTLEKHDFITCVGHNFKATDGRIAMGIDWMTRQELSQAIPPAYTEYIGRQIIQYLKNGA